MHRVMKKDLILNRNVILINGAIFAACLCFFAVFEGGFSPTAYAGFSAFMVAFLPAAMVTREDKFKAMILGCSLPVERRTIVRARFVLSVGMALVGVLGAFLLASFLPFSSLRAGDLFAWGPLMTGLAGITLVLSLLLPFTLRYGMKGILIFLVSAQVLGAVLFAFMQATRSSADKVLVEKIVGALARLHALVGHTAFNALLVIVLLATLGVSYLVSVRVFERREL
jgi:uncharacterized membrane protein